MLLVSTNIKQKKKKWRECHWIQYLGYPAFEVELRMMWNCHIAG